MGRIVFADPGIARFHLHDRLGRELVQRGHQVDALSLDPVAHSFWRAQVQPAVRVRKATARGPNAPVTELAATECRRRGLDRDTAPGRRTMARLERDLQGLFPAVLEWLTEQRPQLVLLHGARTAERRLLQFAARELGITTLWTGDGLLPGTMQLDARGLDADSAAAAREAWEYRDEPRDPQLLAASLAHTLSGARPFGLARSEITPPALSARLLDAVRAAPTGLDAIRHALTGWRRANGVTRPLVQHNLALARPHHVAVLLQSETDERVQLDAAPVPARDLVQAAIRAARAVDPGLGIVITAPSDGLPSDLLAELHQPPEVEVVAARHAHTVAASAAATFSINHPAATTSLLAGTPTIHTGRALFALPGVTHHGAPAAFPELLQLALTEDPASTLRERLLTHLIQQHHVWCDPDEPDHNGLGGFVRAIESRLAGPAPAGLGSSYRPGPAWPLSVRDEP